MAHRYWRIYVTKSTAGSTMLLSLYEVEMRASQGGADLCNNGTPNASHADGDAIKLFDNNLSSYWNNGSPGTDSWFRYDFGSGNAVEVAELWLMPRYSSQSPQDFQCQWSDDNVNWTDRASWVGETAWTGGVGRSFLLPPPPAIKVVSQRTLPYAVTLAAQRPFAFDLGLFTHVQWNMPFAIEMVQHHLHSYGISLELGASHPFGFSLQASSGHLYSVWLDSAMAQPWQHFLDVYLHVPLHDTQEQTRLTPWSLLLEVNQGQTQPWTDTVFICKQHSLPFALLLHNPVEASRTTYWDLTALWSGILATHPAITLNGHPLPLLRAILALKPETFAWVARLTCIPTVDFFRLGVNDPLVLTWGQTNFTLLLDQKEVIRKPGQVQGILTGISRSSQHDFPRAKPVTRIWHEPVWAKDVVEEVLEEEVTWELPNWRIAKDRLQVTNVAPIEVARMVAASVGGVVQTRPDGTLRLRPQFPVALHAWEQTTPDHILTDTMDLLATKESGRFHPLINQVTVQEEIPDELSPFLWLGIDPDPTGPNQGKTRFVAGETVHLLSLVTPGMTLDGLSASTGEFMPSQPTVTSGYEEIIFYQSNKAVLSRPAWRIEETTWLGNDLGPLTLEQDGRTVLAATAGVAIARLRLTLMTQGYHPFKAPNTLDGLNAFPVAVAASATVALTNRRSLTLQRGDGRHIKETLTSPLLSDPMALRARCETELDLGEALHTVSLTLLYRPDIEPGDLVEAHDGMYGSSYRGVVTGVTHELTQDQSLTHLELIRQAQK